MVQVTIRKRPIEDAVITQRKFFKKTARGKVIKGMHPAVPTWYSHRWPCTVIRERYLRDDVSCGIESCRECATSVDTALPVNGTLDHKLFPNGHFILPDTNVFLAQVCSS